MGKHYEKVLFETIICFLFLFGLSSVSFAVTPQYSSEIVAVKVNQQKLKVTGKVTDLRGETLPGVSIVIKDTNQGTITDINGEYNLPDTPDNSILVFSFVGMKTEEVEVNNRTVIAECDYILVKYF